MYGSGGGTSSSPATAPPASRQNPSKNKPSMPVREDCWLEDATHTLVEAWGQRFLELNRGNLWQKHWQEVADAVNALHGHTKNARRTDVQCKNRIDALKKKYKIEKATVSEPAGSYTSQWPFFARLDALIGPCYKPFPPSTAHRETPPIPTPPPGLPLPLSSVPVGTRSKRSVAKIPRAVIDDSFCRSNFSAIAAAAAAAEGEEESETWRSRSSGGNLKQERDGSVTEGFRQLAQAIERLGEIYERVEEAKQREMIKLEKLRFEFAKHLEIQKMKLFMESQTQLEKIKWAKRTSEDENSY